MPDTTPTRELVKLSEERKPTERTIRPLTLAEYLGTVRVRELLGYHHGHGYYVSVRWSGQPQTWKTRPGQVKRPAKYGMYESFYAGTAPGCETLYTIAD